MVRAVEYSPFVIKNIDEIVGDNSNVICSGSLDSTIRFWDIRANKKQLHKIKKEDGILSLKFIQLKTKKKEIKSNDCSGINLCYGLRNGYIHIWG
ncbi:WD-40 repeat family protein [Reticulomyxa filosa]|uniref:WD-40 repeat family protein n=1 Tax=Reticulomyxa filosa TaxID=46433 RepID=X6LLP5_RETFI|nr:WD-40 repeat family protein [Reticulomyxa filosa]|eukprot:ETO02539.1 WD-40 repeat family protein [Reticulomyxa filosa]